MNEQIFWFTTRSAGILTWITAMVAIILGLLLASKILGRRPGYPWLLDLHRFVGGLSVGFLALHILTLWADDFVDFGWAELLVPGQSETQNLAVSFGVIAAWILAAIQVSSLLKRFLAKRVWRGLHLGSYLVAVFGSVHGWLAGSDVQNPIVLALGVGVWTVVVFLTVLRVVAAKERVRRPLPTSVPVVVPVMTREHHAN